MNIKTLALTAVAATSIIVGCKTVPSVDEMTTLGKVSGYTAAYVLNKQVKVDDTTRNAIIDIMNEAEKYIPGTNETFASTWTPIAEKYLNEIKDKDGNPLPEATKARVLKDFNYLVGLLDSYIEKKGIKQYQELTDAFIHSFCDSFLTNFKPANGFSVSTQELDEYTYGYMMGVTGLK